MSGPATRSSPPKHKPCRTIASPIPAISGRPRGCTFSESRAGDAAVLRIMPRRGPYRAAATYPAIDAATGDLLNLEGRINQCRIRHQEPAPRWTSKSDDLLAPDSLRRQPIGWHAHLRSPPMAPLPHTTGTDATISLPAGDSSNLSCHQCHDENWGKRLRGDTISQGHGQWLSGLSLEWQALGSLQRRIRDANAGVRAEPKAFGDPNI